MKKFTLTYTQTMRYELDKLITEAVDVMYDTEKVENIHSMLEEAAVTARKAAFNLYRQLPEDKRFDAQIPHHEAIELIKSLYPNKEDRTIPYKYVNMTRRVVGLNSILTSKKKLRTVAKETLRALVESELQQKRGNKVTISQLIVRCPLKVEAIIFKNGERKEAISGFQLDELKLQFINELVELDLIDLRISKHTHMAEVPKSTAKLIPANMMELMYQLSHMVDKKTISLEPVHTDINDLITKSSWYYRTPAVSADQKEFVETMHNLKYQFVDNALDLIEDAYMEHLTDDEGNLPTNWEKWVPMKLRFLKSQIQASLENGGHYIPGKFDSSLRWYMQSEIGHRQTSPALRKLVKIAGVTDEIKYDFKNNVVQMYATLTKVRDLGKYVGLLPESEREEDLRLLIAKTLNTKLECDVFNKDNIKPLFMVWAYNAGKTRILDGVTTVESQLFGMEDKVNVKVNGLMALTGATNNDKNRDLIWNAFEEAVIELTPVIVILKGLFRKLIKLNPLMETSWTLPDGAIAQYASPESKTATLYWVTNEGKQHQHTHHRKELEVNAKSAGLLPRVIHSFDAYVVRQLIIRAAILGIIIVPNHDSFTFDNKHLDDVLILVKEILSELLESDAFASVLCELNKSGKSLAIKDASGTIITDEVLHTKYGRLGLDDIAASDPMDIEE